MLETLRECCRREHYRSFILAIEQTRKMASVIGKWKIQTSENFDEYMRAIGVSDDKREIAHKYLSDGSNMTQEFAADGDKWTIKTCTVMGEKTVTFTLGKELESETLDGRKVKIVFTTDGDSLVEKQIGDGFECTHVRQGLGGILTTNLIGNHQTCVRKFVKM